MIICTFQVGNRIYGYVSKEGDKFAWNTGRPSNRSSCGGTDDTFKEALITGKEVAEGIAMKDVVTVFSKEYAVWAETHRRFEENYSYQCGLILEGRM